MSDPKRVHEVRADLWSTGDVDDEPEFALLLEWHVDGLRAVVWGDPSEQWLRDELRELADGFTFRTPQQGGQ